MPPGTSDERRDEYASIIKEISSDGAGVYPDGGEIHTVETSAANADAFSSLAEWCDKALVRRATGGLLTVLAESGSGTLAGSAHMEAFRQIAANDAIRIAECINRQYVRRRIAAEFPGQPELVYFKLTPPVINDRAATVQMLCQLAGQRWRATDEAVSEEVGMEVHTEAQNAPQPTGASPRPEALANRSSEQQSVEDSPGEAPLNDGELAALRALGGELNPAQVAADAEYMAGEMLAGLEDSDELENRDYKRSSDGRFASTGAATHSHKGGRGSQSKKGLGKTGSPKLAEPGDSKSKVKDVLQRGFDDAKKGKKVTTGVQVGRHEVVFAPGDIEHWGTHHAERSEHKKLQAKGWRKQLFMVHQQKKRMTIV